MLNHLRGQGDDLHELPLPELPRHRPEEEPQMATPHGRRIPDWTAHGLRAALVLMLIPASSSALQAGAARVSLVPETVVGLPMIGYTDRYDMPAEGLHDSLYARVLVLDDGVTRVALASLDLLAGDGPAAPRGDA